MIEVVYLRVDSMEPNPWNPNKMTDEMLRKEEESIREFGFVDPITVRRRRHMDKIQIIDGEHRWKAAANIGLEEIPCIILDVDDTTAEQLTIVLNDLRGKPNEERLAALVKDLSARRSMLDLERVLPYKRERLAEMIAERKADFDWDALKRPKAEEKQEETRQWVERIYRLPHSAAAVIDEAIGKVKSEGVNDDWQALELICADYMSGV
jgi:ParB-like chromosome segregation protein Spo0J